MRRKGTLRHLNNRESNRSNKKQLADSSLKYRKQSLPRRRLKQRRPKRKLGREEDRAGQRESKLLKSSEERKRKGSW